MSHKILREHLDHTIRLLDEGMSLEKASKIVGFTADNLSRHLRNMSVETDRRCGRKASNRLPIDTKMVVSAYISGDSENAIAKKIGVSRNVIRTRLLDAGVCIRSGSEANVIRFNRATATERKLITSAANA